MTPADPTLNGVGSGPFILRVSPIALDRILAIQPLGNLNPPGHTLPTDHIYFSFADPTAGESPVDKRTDFFAPADGTVFSVIDNGLGLDRKVTFRGTTRVLYYIDHLIPSVPLSTGTRVHAGDRLGTTGSVYAIDLGVINADTTLTGFVNLARYPGMEHTDAPLRHYEEPVRSQLYAKVRRLGPDLDGRIDFDIPCRLSGNWFGETDQAPLVFVYDSYDPTVVRIAMASGLRLAPAVLGIAATDPPPRDVSVASGKVTYTITRYGAPLPSGHMLVQMLDDQRIRVEVFTPITAAATDFTSASRLFLR